MSLSVPHNSVFIKEFIAFYQDLKINVFVDCTLGAGGHSKALLETHPEVRLLIGIDQDPLSINIARERLRDFEEKAHFVNANFKGLQNILLEYGVSEVDGIFLDIGVSSMQLDRAEKGFSFSKEGPLDMRMDPTSSLSAEMIINAWTEEEIGRIFRDYGEERNWRALARAIVMTRERRKIKTTKDLENIVLSFGGSKKKHQKIHPATRIFQALRICVNNELEILRDFLPRAIDVLRSGGRLGVITFHSLEDRIVKNIYKEAASSKRDLLDAPDSMLEKEPSIRILTKKPLTPSFEEIRRNPRSRSAKLRFAEKI